MTHLRDQIAAAIRNCDYNVRYRCIGEHGSREFADAVLDVLGLQAETSYGTTYPQTPVRDRTLTRYVTDWRDDEDA